VFQTFNLLAACDGASQCRASTIYNGTPAEERLERAKKALERVDWSTA